MPDLYEARLQSVVEALEWLDARLMLFGAGVLPLYIDSKDVRVDLRPTEDVDALVELSGVERQADLGVVAIESALQKRGWKLDMRPHRRNVHAYRSPTGIAVDFVFDAQYPPDDWPVVAQKTAMQHKLSTGQTIRIPTPALYLVCKVEASRNPKRWEGPYDSHDLEDVAALMSGCSALESSLLATPPEACTYLTTWAQELRSGSTVYGQQAYACLEGNWPRGADASVLDHLLEVMASLG